MLIPIGWPNTQVAGSGVDDDPRKAQRAAKQLEVAGTNAEIAKAETELADLKKQLANERLEKPQ